MKKWTIMIFPLLVLFGCGIENGEETTGENNEEDLSEIEEVENPDFVEVDPEEKIISQDTERVVFTVSNHREDYTLHGGEYYHLDYYTDGAWEEITPVEDFEDIGYVLEHGDSHEFSHRVMAQDETELDEGAYRIRKEFYMVDGTENVISEDAEEIETVMHFRVK